MKRYLLIFLVAFPFLAIGQMKTIEMIETENDYYRWITFLSEGKIELLDVPGQDGVEGISYRVIITTSEIYKQIYIETAAYGTKGCCKKIIDKRELPLKEIFEAFKLKGKVASVEFVEWISPVCFIFKIDNDKFRVEDIHMDGPIVFKI